MARKKPAARVRESKRVRVLFYWTGHWWPDMEVTHDDPERTPVPGTVYTRIWRWLFVGVYWGLNKGKPGQRPHSCSKDSRQG